MDILLKKDGRSKGFDRVLVQTENLDHVWRRDGLGKLLLTTTLYLVSFSENYYLVPLCSSTLD